MKGKFMSYYRKITVDGQEYEYKIYRTNAKVKGLGNFTHNVDSIDPSGKDRYSVTPKHVAEFIKQNTERNK